MCQPKTCLAISRGPRLTAKQEHPTQAKLLERLCHDFGTYLNSNPDTCPFYLLDDQDNKQDYALNLSVVIMLYLDKLSVCLFIF